MVRIFVDSFGTGKKHSLLTLLSVLVMVDYAYFFAFKTCIIYFPTCIIHLLTGMGFQMHTMYIYNFIVQLL